MRLKEGKWRCECLCEYENKIEQLVLLLPLSHSLLTFRLLRLLCLVLRLVFVFVDQFLQEAGHVALLVLSHDEVNAARPLFLCCRNESPHET